MLAGAALSDALTGCNDSPGNGASHDARFESDSRDAGPEAKAAEEAGSEDARLESDSRDAGPEAKAAEEAGSEDAGFESDSRDAGLEAKAAEEAGGEDAGAEQLLEEAGQDALTEEGVDTMVEQEAMDVDGVPYADADQRGEFEVGQEVCNGRDDDGDGVVDLAACLVEVYRFYDPDTGDHMYKSGDITPDTGYRLEGFTRFKVYRDKVPGTIALYQVTNGKDHMLTLAPGEGSGVGYHLDRILGYILQSNPWTPGGLEYQEICRYFNPINGDHMLFVRSKELETYGYNLEMCGVYVWDWVFEGFTPPLCHASADPDCTSVSQWLPVVTHWDGGFRYLGTGQVDLWQENPMPDPAGYVPGQCYPVYKLGFPDYEQYFGDIYSIAAIPDEEAGKFLESACETNGLPVRLLAPASWKGAYPEIESPESASCIVQIVHASIVDGSLATVFLPPNWTDKAPDRTYPIVVNSIYDLNDTTFRANGGLMAMLAAQSGLDGRRGAIGVITNGGGALASHGFDEGMLDQAAEVISWVAERFHGNPYEVITFGGSRGGYTSLAIASNPKGYDYRVVLAVSVAPPTLVGSHIDLVSPTYTGLFIAAETDIGLADSWLSGWTYPECAGRPELTGKTRNQALLHVLTGTTDPAEADATRGLGSDAFVHGLKAAGTQVHLEVTAHDFICPYHLQVLYGAKIIQEGIPVEAHILLRNGHMPRPDTYARVLPDAVGTLTAPGYSPTGPDSEIPDLIYPGLHFWTIDRQTGQYAEIFPKDYPFTFEGPYKVASGQRYPYVFVGQEGTSFDLKVKSGDTTYQTVSGTLSGNGVGVKVVWQEVPPAPAGGPYSYDLRILKPGGSWTSIPSTNTPSGDPAVLYVLDREPVVRGKDAATEFAPPHAPVAPSTNWGLSEY